MLTLTAFIFTTIIVIAITRIIIRIKIITTRIIIRIKIIIGMMIKMFFQAEDPLAQSVSPYGFGLTPPPSNDINVSLRHHEKIYHNHHCHYMLSSHYHIQR